MSVRNALLGLLARQPSHGYELHAAFESLVGGAENWDLNPAQVYTALDRMAKGGLVAQQAIEQDGGPEKIVYAISEAGRQELSCWFTTPTPTDYQRDEVYLKLVLAIATGIEDPTTVIYTQRASLYRELHALQSRRSQGDPHRELALVLLLDQAMMRLDADIRWLEMVEARLEEIRRQPLPQPEERPRGRPPGRPRALRAE